jgi:exopolyphosphatase/guanosine-5'-triphosphate,3'-diphosphate pyrophosphatase
MTGLAAIDIGSNAIRFGVGCFDDKRGPTFVEELREPIRLGDEVFKRGVISEEALRRVEAAFTRFKGILERHAVVHYRAVATSAVREARNRTEFIERIRRVSGIDVDVISGAEEARLVYLAVRQVCQLKGKLALLVDIGGGSVEISIVKNSEVIFSESIKMGAVRLLELLRGRPQGDKICARLVRGYVDGLRRRLKRELRGRRIELCIGTGGNIESLGDLRVALLERRSSTEVDSKDLDKLVQKIARLSYAERIAELGLRPDRADVVLPAAIMVREILRNIGTRKMVVPRVGLKDGVLSDLISRSAPRSPRAQQRHARVYALEVGRRLGFDEAHAEAVTKWALKLFEDLKGLHRCSSDYLLAFEIGCLLHDIGHIVNVNGHHKHSWYLIQACPLVGLSEGERRIAACIARYHRKSFPKKEHPEFAALDGAEQAAVTKLAAILRLADGCDAGHMRSVRGVRTRLQKGKVEISLRGEGDLLLERWTVGRKADLFKETFKCDVVVK